MTFKRPYGAGLAALAVGLFAATAACAEPTVNKGDNAWMLTSTVLVLLMTIPGLALFYGGLVRSKNMSRRTAGSTRSSSISPTRSSAIATATSAPTAASVSGSTSPATAQMKR